MCLVEGMSGGWVLLGVRRRGLRAVVEDRWTLPGWAAWSSWSPHRGAHLVAPSSSPARRYAP